MGGIWGEPSPGLKRKGTRHQQRSLRSDNDPFG
jgi:hypothetical protein